ncbi:hypothetical protein FRB95_013869 [Tulasnella sp. JGI-2019a]|nr:hypothetical protein FRB95_013869 [Tulasnella sp. JGI-2019a]
MSSTLPGYQQRARNTPIRSRSSSNNTISSSTEPPCYPPEASRVSSPPPVYNSRPTPNENTLIAGAIPPPEGVVTQRTKHFVIALTRQPDRAIMQNGAIRGEESRPIYGRAGVIAGMVELKDDNGLKMSDVLSVILRITGKIKLDISEGGMSTYAFLEHAEKLYNSADYQPNASTCPSMLTFSYTLPTAYTEHSTDSPEPLERALPPTYEVAYDGIPGMRVAVKYTIKFRVERKRLWKLTQTHELSIPFDYVPRSRPPMPGPEPTASFAAALKQSPEEWTVFVNDVPRRETPTKRPVQYAMDTSLSNGETVTSSFVLPSSQTFPLSRAIPFHLQLSLSSPPSPTLAPQPPPPVNSSPLQLFPRRSKTTPGNRSDPSTSLEVPRPSTAPSPSTTTTLLSLFSNPTFGPSPRRGRRPYTAIVGLGEGIAGDGAMAFGDPRHGNVGRHPGGIVGDAEGGGSRLVDDVAGENSLTTGGVGIGTPNRPLSLGSVPSGGSRPGAASAAPRSSTSSSAVFSPREGSMQRPATAAGTISVPRRDPSPMPPVDQSQHEGVSYIRVFLQRQIVVTVKGQKVVKTIACGDGKLHRITLDDPPTFSDINREQEEDTASSIDEDNRPQLQRRRTRSLSPRPQHASREGLDYIAWEGHVLPKSDTLTVGGFRATNLWVKDFITLTMLPPNPEQSPLRALHHAVPVRLVSDPWEEEWWVDRRY